MKFLDTTLSQAGPAFQGVPAGSINFIQQGTKEAVTATNYGLFEALSGGVGYATSSTYLIWGCNQTVTGGGPYTYTINQGAILYNNEIFLVPTTPLFVSNTSWTVAIYGTINTFNSPTLDPVLFSDGSTHNVNNDRTIQVILATGPSGIPPTAPAGSLFNFNTLTSFSSVPAQCAAAVSTAVTTAITDVQLFFSATSWTLATLSTGWNNPASSQTSYTKDGFGQVYLGGVIGNNVNTPPLTGFEYVLFTLPVGYRTSRQRRFSVTVYNNNASTFIPGYIQVDTTGVVGLVIQGVSITTTGWYVYLDSVTFLTI